METVEVRGSIAVDELLFARGMVRAGAGIGLLPSALFDVDSPHVRRVLPAYASQRGAIHIVYPGARHIRQVHIRGEAPGEAMLEIRSEDTGELIDRIEIRIAVGSRPSVPATRLEEVPELGAARSFCLDDVARISVEGIDREVMVISEAGVFQDPVYFWCFSVGHSGFGPVDATLRWAGTETPLTIPDPTF